MCVCICVNELLKLDQVYKAMQMLYKIFSSETSEGEYKRKEREREREEFRVSLILRVEAHDLDP